MRRGRPKHDDILTPREWEVLTLLEEGLTNDQIARRLRVSENTAKYHVSQIFSKLGVGRREEAAVWRRERDQRRFESLSPLAWLIYKATSSTAAKLATGSVIVGTAAGLILLALGLLVMDERGPAAVTTGDLGKLAYVQNGDVWVRALPDGAPFRLTNDGASSEPRWSPTGRWLTLLKGQKGRGEYWVVRADGSGSRRLGSIGAFWSPKDDTIAYVRDSQTIVIEDPSGSSLREIRAPGAASLRLMWSPDGRLLAYEWTDQTTAPRSPARTPSQSTTPPLTPPPSGSPPPLFTPAGPPPLPTAPDRAGVPAQLPQWYSGLWVVDVQSGSQIEVFNNGGDVQTGRVIPVGWSPDGRQVLFALAPSFSASFQMDGLPLKAVNVSSGQARDLGVTVLNYEDFLDESPDKVTLVLALGGGRSAWTNKRVAIFDMASGRVNYLTAPSTASFSPSWSPNGQLIAYVSGPDTGDVPGGNEAVAGMAARRIWMVNADGSGAHRLTSDETYREERPLWSSDGTQILFVRVDVEGKASLWLVSSAGGQPTKVTDITQSPTDLPDDTNWFGIYGHVAWEQVFDWWQAVP